MRQLAGALQLNVQTVQRFVREGKIKAVKIGREYRVTEQGLKDYLELSTEKVVENI